MSTQNPTCLECSLPASSDLHDGGGAGRHAYNDGECRALTVYDPRFLRFDWSTVADAAERACINELKSLNEQYRSATQAVRLAQVA